MPTPESPSQNPAAPTAPTVAAALAHRRRRRRRTGAIAALAIIALAAVGWHLLHRASAVKYVTAPVTRGDVTKAITASGTINPQTTVQVGSYVSGSIDSVSCDFNTQVKKNQLCAKIDPRPYQSTVDQDQANLMAGQAQLAKDNANLVLLQQEYQRTQDLFQKQLVSQDQLDTAKASYEQAKSQVSVDQSAIDQRSAALKSAQVNLGYTNIVSPVDGTVVSRNVTVGQTVAASFQTPTLFLIATDLTKMQVDTSVSESDIGDVKVNAPVSFTVEAFPNKGFNGVVAQVRQAPVSVENVVTYDVVVTVSNPDLLLKPGMTANVRIVVDLRQQVLRVPDQALRYTPGGVAAAAAASGRAASAPSGLLSLGRGVSGRSGAPRSTGAASGKSAAPPAGGSTAHVYVLQNGAPVEVTVTVGLDDDTNTEIVQGALAEGQQVVVSESSGTAAAGSGGA